MHDQEYSTETFYFQGLTPYVASRIFKANGRAESSALNEALTKLRNKATYLLDNQAVFQERFTTNINKLLNGEPCSFQGAIDSGFTSKARLPIEKFIVSKFVIIGDRDNETTDEKAYRQTLYRGSECIDVMPYQRISDLLRR